MLTLIVTAAIGQQCFNQVSGYGYGGYSYAAPTVSYQATYQTPSYNYDYSKIVGDYLRQERSYQQQSNQQAQIDKLTLIVEKLAQPAPQPVQQPIFQAPPPPAKAMPTPQYALPTPQVPEKAPPVFQAAPQQPYYGDQAPPPPYAPPKAAPSFGAPYGAGYPGQQPQQFQPQPAGNPVAALTSIFQTKCAQCHAGDATQGGGYRFLGADGTLAASEVLNHADEIMGDIDSGRMPKGGQRLPWAEKMAIYQGLQQLAGQPQQQPTPVASTSGSFGY